MKLAVVLLAGLCLAACSSSLGTTTPGPASSTKPGPPASPIQHVVILIQENRSFNNLFMGFPGAVSSSTGMCKEFDPPGSSKPICPGGQLVTLHKVDLKTGRARGSGVDIEHGHHAFEVEYDGGKMDGFGSIYFGTNYGSQPAGTYPYAYVNPQAVKPYWDMASQYGLADHMFTTETTDSFVAHQEFIAATAKLNDHVSLTDTPTNLPWGCDNPVKSTKTHLLHKDGKVTADGPFPCFTQYPTMADVLGAANVSWKYYVESYDQSSPDGGFAGEVWDAFDAIKKVRYGSDWKHVSMPQKNVLKDIAGGNLPQVSWVIPNVFASDHPASGDNKGPSWVTAVVNAIGKSPYWKNTAIIVVWDDWGGWYDPVPPPQLDYTSLGLRVPMILISPYARPHYVSKTQYEFGSILKFVEQNFGTGNLGATDVRATSIADMFNFNQAPIPFKPFTAAYPKSYFLENHPQPSMSNFKEHDGSPPE